MSVIAQNMTIYITGLLLAVMSLLFNVRVIHLKLNEGTTDTRKRESTQ